MAKENSKINFHSEVLDRAQRRALKKLGGFASSRNFYLAGGTAVALHLGHRRSIDFDWFTKSVLGDPLRLAQDIRNVHVPFTTFQIERGTLHGRVSNIKVSFLEFRYPLLKGFLYWPDFECNLASLEDLCCMKLSALAQRGSKRDFIDIYAIGTCGFSLEKMVELYQRKFSVKDIAHLIYGLTYFDSAEKERMPKVLLDFNWPDVKKTITDWVKHYIRG